MWPSQSKLFNATAVSIVLSTRFLYLNPMIFSPSDFSGCSYAQMCMNATSRTSTKLPVPPESML